MPFKPRGPVIPCFPTEPGCPGKPGEPCSPLPVHLHFLPPVASISQQAYKIGSKWMIIKFMHILLINDFY